MEKEELKKIIEAKGCDGLSEFQIQLLVEAYEKREGKKEPLSPSQIKNENIQSPN